MSSDSNQPKSGQSFPDDTVRRVLMRATELDAARSAELSLEELQDVAREAGITPSALDQAIAELNSSSLAEETEVKPTLEGKGVNRIRPVAVGALLTFGLIASAVFVYSLARLFP